MKKRCMPSFVRGTTREDATKIVLSQTDHQMLTRRKHTLINYHIKSPQKFQVPEPLYIHIRAALSVKQRLKTNPGDEDLSFSLIRLERFVRKSADELHKANGHLPSDWEYDPESASSYVPFRPPVAFKKKPKKRPLNPHFESTSLREKDMALWVDFQNKTSHITTHKGLPFPDDESIKTELDKDDKFVSFIRDFAVDVFNKSYQMYFDKDKNENISRAKVTECKYIKVNPCYLFYMTIEAYEQGKLGVYEIELRCDLGDGKIVLDSFCLRDPKPWGKRERVITRSISKTVTGKRTSAITSLGPIYETVTDDLTDPKDYYGLSGMTCRTVGGYDYYNPCGWNSFCWIC